MKEIDGHNSMAELAKEMKNNEIVAKINEGIAKRNSEKAPCAAYDRSKNRTVPLHHGDTGATSKEQATERLLKQARALSMREKVMKVKLDPGAIMPTRAHDTDAGLDLYAPYDYYVEATKRARIFNEYGSITTNNVEIGSCTIDTGVHVQIPEGYVGFVKAKSGLNVKYGLNCTGVIDAGYTGSIVVKLYNFTADEYSIKKGDKIAQLVIVPIITPELELVDELEETERGTGGFGSTGR